MPQNSSKAACTFKANSSPAQTFNSDVRCVQYARTRVLLFRRPHPRNRSKPPWHSIKSPVKAVTSMSSLSSPISVGRPLLLLLSHPSPSRSSPTWAVPRPSPKTSASTASPPSSSRPVKPTAPPVTNPPFRAARAYFPAPPQNLPGR